MLDLWSCIFNFFL